MKNSNWMFVWLFFAAVFAVLRFFMPHHEPSLPGTYTAFAHIFIGALFGAWLVSREKWYMWTLVALTVVETIAFFTLK